MKLFLTLFLFLIIHNSFAQDSKTKAFISLFQEIEFKTQHVYSFARHPDDFPVTSTYPFKGTKIDSFFHSLFNTVIDSDEWNRSVFYATHKFFMNGNIEALLIRESQMEGTEHHIYCLTFNHEENKMTSSLELSYGYGYEGSFGGMESWILDVDKDGQKDVLSRMWRESNFSTDDGGLEVMNHDSVIISIFDKNKFREIGVKDTLLQKEIKKDFPYYQEHYLSYQTEQDLSGYLKKESDVGIRRQKGNSWIIIAGSDEDLATAEHEIKRVSEIIGFNYKYGLDKRLFEINENNNRFYTIAKSFGTRAEAEIALREIQRIFNKTAYIVEYEAWCPKPEYQKWGYYRCGN